MLSIISPPGLALRRRSRLTLNVRLRNSLRNPSDGRQPRRHYKEALPHQPVAMSKEHGLDSAVAKAVEEVQQASISVSKGASPEDAFLDKVGQGAEDAIDETKARLEREPNNPSLLVLRFGSSKQRWALSTSGNLLVPITDDIVASVLAPDAPGQDEREKRKRRDEMAKSGKHLKDIMELAGKVQKAVGAPASTAPFLSKALMPTPSAIAQLPVLVSLFSIYWLRKRRSAT